ncbi:hypothetical protein A0256_05650 [Mucilaginibacter sp. PAMC 26640]|nr:hypothetical protein A0256_05650 [Mucilaginibacter sp. PAMC 26640]
MNGLDSTGNRVFALLKVHTVENIFNLKYTLSRIMGLNLRLRHYWIKLNNEEIFILAKDGALATLSSSKAQGLNPQHLRKLV